MRSRALSVHDRHAEANVVAHQALEAAEEAGAERLAAEISVNVAFTEDTGSEDSYREGLAAAIDRAERAGALLPELRGRMLLGLSMLNFGELDDAAPVLAGGLARAEEQGVPWAPYAFDCRARLIQVDFMRGRWDEGLALADVVGAPPILRAWLDALRLGIEQARGADVRAPLAGLRPYWTQEFEVLANAAPVEMTEAGRRGDVAGILASYDAAVAAAVPVWGEWFEARVRLAAIAIAELARVLPQLSVGERAVVADHVRRLRDDGRRVEPRDRFGGAWGPEGQAWLSRLEAEERRARWLAGVDPPEHEELVGAWHDSVRAFTEFGHAYELARARIALATVLRAGGDPAGARAAADLAREAARALGAQPLLDELQALGSAPVRAERSSEDLTPREQEILVLVAQGRTNGEIGKQLFISTKTVSVHVSNILAKLQAAGRTEAAAIARRRGLLPEG